MLNKIEFYGEITEIRRLITKPTLKSPQEARQAFTEYVKEHHEVSALESPEGKELLKTFRNSVPMKSLLDYMELSGE